MAIIDGFIPYNLSVYFYILNNCIVPLLDKLDNLRWFSQRRSRTPHFWGCAAKETMTPKFELGRDFCTMHLPQVSSSCVYSFGSYHVAKQKHTHTNKQTPLKTPNALRYATTLANEFFFFFFFFFFFLLLLLFLFLFLLFFFLLLFYTVSACVLVRISSRRDATRQDHTEAETHVSSCVSTKQQQ